MRKIDFAAIAEAVCLAAIIASAVGVAWAFIQIIAAG